jgi:glycerol-3-phosphate cytidylyltransferase|tara:strand:+ start:180 stop:602 length:423 start_codon:yes stop_codon:yes gene_type:complete
MKKNKIVGITFGSFDLCHYGHALMFEECKEYCDYLIVGVQSDPNIDRPEKNKPVQSHKERIGIVSSLKFVDEVISYDTEADLVEILKKVEPDVRILGADHKGTQFTGYELPIKCIFNSRDHGFSTSELRKRVHEAEKNNN